jgi:hypothetical protein
LSLSRSLSELVVLSSVRGVVAAASRSTGPRRPAQER